MGLQTLNPRETKSLLITVHQPILISKLSLGSCGRWFNNDWFCKKTSGVMILPKPNNELCIQERKKTPPNDVPEKKWHQLWSTSNKKWVPMSKSRLSIWWNHILVHPTIANHTPMHTWDVVEVVPRAMRPANVGAPWCILPLDPV